ncbi:MAG: SAM-dependent methyltransferase [Bacteroidales bacterium]|nr:SAM-dependent methyltransferase [Bacteroidales bacterium]
MEHGRLILIPTLLGDSSVDAVMPANLRNVINGMKHFIVEDLRTARRFLKKVDRDIDIDSLVFFELNKHTPEADIRPMIQPMLEGHDTGLMSEAGTPCVADPGSMIVSLAHDSDIKVIPLSGPSSITLALMASGFNGQNFVFHGYLPVESKNRQSALKRIEQDAYRLDQTQIFIETPYRNMQMLESILKTCLPGTRLCIAANLTTSLEMIRTLPVSRWKKEPPAIHKQPAVFLIYK